MDANRSFQTAMFLCEGNLTPWLRASSEITCFLTLCWALPTSALLHLKISTLLGYFQANHVLRFWPQHLRPQVLNISNRLVPLCPCHSSLQGRSTAHRPLTWGLAGRLATDHPASDASHQSRPFLSLTFLFSLPEDSTAHLQVSC